MLFQSTSPVWGTTAKTAKFFGRFYIKQTMIPNISLKLLLVVNVSHVFLKITCKNLVRSRCLFLFT